MRASSGRPQRPCATGEGRARRRNSGHPVNGGEILRLHMPFADELIGLHTASLPACGIYVAALSAALTILEARSELILSSRR
jgi:hypothetical protein